MLRWSSLGWSCLALYLALAALDIWRLFYPSLQARAGEHVFAPSWQPQGDQPQRYAWRVCLSHSARDISAQQMDPANCILDERGLTLNDSLALRFNATVPAHWLRPFVKQQTQYAQLHAALQDADAELKAAQVDSSTGASAALRTVAGKAKRVADKLMRLVVEMTSASLHAHAFFFRHTPGGPDDPLADEFHVHTSTPLVARWVVPVNDTRSLLGARAAGAGADAATNASALATLSSSPSRSSHAQAQAQQELVHVYRSRLDWSFVSSPLRFPASRVPDDLRSHFPLRRDSAGRLKGLYAPIIASSDMTLLRREWLRFNESVLDAAAAESARRTSASSTAQGSSSGGGDEGESYSTTAALSAGESDTPVAGTEGGGARPPLRVLLALDAATLGWFRFTRQMQASMSMIASVQDGLGSAAQGAADRTLAATGNASAKESKLYRDLLAHDGMNEDKGREVDDMRSMMADSNPLLLGVTFAVAILHLLFDFLAFKNDVAFWRARKNNYVGISARSVWISASVRTVIFLYLLDNDTSKLVLLSSGASLAILYWKSVKILRISVGLSKRFPFVLRFGELPKAERTTQDFDTQAMKWLGWMALPFIIGASVYSLLYHTHKSWYSWVLASCASAVYTGGFILMTPQLFVNYKLKSVAHLPLRVFVYRACNTFLDDLFAFVITQPWMNRLACFRDDIIFFIYMYQRWIYPVDHSRTIRLDEDDADGDSDSDAHTFADALITPLPDDESLDGKAEDVENSEPADARPGRGATLTLRHQASANSHANVK